ncbi:transferase family protein, partial [Metarhizium majus ARSEF 297]
MRVVVDRDALNTPSWEVSKTAMSFDTLKAKGFHRRLWPDGIRIAEPQIARNAGDASKLLRVHVARLAGNSGVAIVLCIAHAVVDAKGAVAFMKHWADCCRRRNHLVVSCTASPSPPQQTCAALLCLRSVMYEKLSQDARPHVHCLVVSLLGLALKRNLTVRSTRSHLFRVRRDKLDSVKNLATTRSTSSDCISYNDILVAIFTIAYAQCTMQEKSASSPASKGGIFRQKPPQASAIVPCDFRHRLGVPEGYTGNCAVGLFVCHGAVGDAAAAHGGDERHGSGAVLEKHHVGGRWSDD